MEIAELVVKRMNEAVLDSEFHDRCVQLRVNETETIKLTLKEFSPRDGKQLYRAELRVSPSGGYYEALAEVICLRLLYAICPSITNCRRPIQPS